jgi:transcriptional regulator with XRE-family HTH domain
VPEIQPLNRAPTLLFVPREKRSSFGKHLRELRKLKGITQEELAAAVGLSRRMIVYYETQGGSPSPDLLVKLARALSVSCEILLGQKQHARRQNASAIQLEDVRLLRRLKRLEELPLHDRKAVLRMIDALADRVGKRKAG